MKSDSQDASYSFTRYVYFTAVMGQNLNSQKTHAELLRYYN